MDAIEPQLMPRIAEALRRKRCFDVPLACVLFAFAVPVMLLCMAIVKCTSRGPTLYTQTRVGRYGQPFTLRKIRTMIHDCERRSGIRWSSPDDARVTRVGRVLRATHLDELPQLWNVIVGEMSLVGPRPERPEIVRLLVKQVPGYRMRTLVPPGITGRAQVCLPPETHVGMVPAKVEHDLAYIRALSLRQDCSILLATLGKVIGVVRPAVGAQSLREAA